MQEETGPGVDSLPQPYESPKVEHDGLRTRTEPLPSLFIIILGFMFCLLCHAITTFALFSYIDKTGVPTSKAIDSVFFGYAPISASIVGCILTIAMISFGRAMLRNQR